MIDLLHDAERWLWDLSRGSDVALGDLLLVLALSFVMGQLVAWTYTFTHRGLSYSRGFVQSLLLINMIVAVVMVVVGDSLARAFGLVGALAIIRFRTAIRDTRDIAFVFLALVSGIAAGCGHYLAALIGTPIICLVGLYLGLAGLGERNHTDAFLRFRLAGDETAEGRLQRILKRYCRSFSLQSVSTAGPGEPSEHSFQLRLLDASLREPMLLELRDLEGMAGVDLLIQDRTVQP